MALKMEWLSLNRNVLAHEVIRPAWHHPHSNHTRRPDGRAHGQHPGSSSRDLGADTDPALADRSRLHGWGYKTGWVHRCSRDLVPTHHLVHQAHQEPRLQIPEWSLPPRFSILECWCKTRDVGKLPSRLPLFLKRWGFPPPPCCLRSSTKVPIWEAARLRAWSTMEGCKE